jgi:hypothetical protein
MTGAPIDPQKKLIDHLRAKAPNFHCPVCLGKNFDVLPQIVSGIPIAKHQVEAAEGKTIPLAMIVCTNCYHIMHFAALPIGMIEAGKPKPVDPDGGENG